MRPLTEFSPKIKASQLQKKATFHLFEVQIRYWKNFKFGPEHFFKKIK